MRTRWIASVVCCMATMLCIGQTKSEERFIQIARDSVIAEINHSPQPKLDSETSPRPVFVTIEVGGTVRGCRGALIARSGSLETEIAKEARDAAAHDPRYRPLSSAELKKFLVTVTIVEREQPLDDVATLTPADGIVLRSGGHTGIVLPWEGKDPKTRLAWAYKKAGVGRQAPASLTRLIATRFRG